MGLRHLPVTDKVNNIVGMITRKDLVEVALEEALAGLAAQTPATPPTKQVPSTYTAGSLQVAFEGVQNNK